MKIINKIWLIAIAMLPILNNYHISFLNQRLGIIVIILLTPFVLINSIGRKYRKGRMHIIAFWVVVTIIFVVNAIVNKTETSWIFEFLYLLLLISSIFISTRQSKVNSNTFIYSVVWIATISSLIIIFQYMLYFVFSIHVPFIFKSLLSDQNRVLYNNLLETGMHSGYYRPSSIFLEPAHLAQFSVVALIFSLFLKNRKRIHILFPILISISILLSTSSQGIFLAIFIWVSSIVMEYKSPQDLGKRFLKLFAVTLLVLTLFATVGIFQTAINRVFTGNFETSAAFGRLSGFYVLQNEISNKLFFGYGHLSEPNSLYLTGGIVFLYRYGIIGITLFIVFLLYDNRNAGYYNLLLIFTFFTLLIVSAIYGLSSMIFYLPAISMFSEYLRQYNLGGKYEKNIR